MSAVKKLMAVMALLLLILLPGCGGETPAASGSGAVAISSAPQVPGEKAETKPSGQPSKYTRKDIEKLQHRENFAKGALEHIFDGTINKKGKATGYHYSMVEDSRGRILEGTRSKSDANGVFKAKVQVEDVRKNGFSSFYPEAWSPQEVVDAINAAYLDAIQDPGNPRGDLWIGHFGDMEIDMYLNDRKKILTAYPIYVEKKK